MLPIIELPTWLVAFTLVFCGMILRTWMPYIKKVRDLKDLARATGKTEAEISQISLSWDHSYTLALAADAIICLVGTIFFFSAWTPPEGSQFQIAVASFIAGWGAQDIINTLQK
jgi:hypothetical protein